MQIAIDGPAASGKSTAARLLARKLNFLYVDTGAMYRAVTLRGIEEKIDFEDPETVVEIAQNLNFNFEQDWNSTYGYRVYVNGEDVTRKLFQPRVDQFVSVVAKIPGVREILVKKQRQIASDKNVVMAGRDITSNVLKKADVKFFLTADPVTRARRRQKELENKGINRSFEQIFQNITRRDEIDSRRADNPLVKVPEAIEVDCSNLTIPQMVDKLLKEVNKITGIKKR